MTRNRRGSLFLVELLCSLALFVLCACVCVGLIVHAWGLSRESQALTQAVYMAQTAAEEWRAGLLEESESWCTSLQFPQLTADGCRLFDAAGEPIPSSQAAQAQADSQAAYLLTLTVSPSSQGLTQGEITVYASFSEEPLYTLEVSLL